MPWKTHWMSWTRIYNIWTEMKQRCENHWQYYVIESALCDEDKLEQFLLDNIKVE